MDASGVVGLVQMAGCCRALHGLFSEGAVKASMGLYLEASTRANRSEGHRQDLMGMMVEVASQRDAAEQRADAADQRAEAAEQVARELRAHIREMAVARRQLEQAHVGELAEAKRARR